MRNEIIVRDDQAHRLFPAIQVLDYRTAVKLALEKLDAHAVETAWSGALSTSQRDVSPVTLTTHEGMIIEQRQLPVAARAMAASSADPPPVKVAAAFLLSARDGGLRPLRPSIRMFTSPHVNSGKVTFSLACQASGIPA